MLAKLFKGELSLRETFWVFGLPGLIILKIAVSVFGSLLLKKINGMSILYFYTHHFHPFYTPKLTILWTLCYLSSILLLIWFSVNILIGLWKSSAEYNKSLWLRYLARFFMALAVFLVWDSIQFRPLF